MSRHRRKHKRGHGSRRDSRRIAKEVERIMKRHKRDSRHYSSSSDENDSSSSAGLRFSAGHARRDNSGKWANITESKKYALSSQTYSAEEASRYRDPELLVGKRSRSRSSDGSAGSQEESTRNNKKIRRSPPNDITSPNMNNVVTDPSLTREEVPTEKKKSSDVQMQSTLADENTTANTTLNEKVLNVIGQPLQAERILAAPVHDTFKNRWREVLQLGLPKEEREEVMKKYPIPGNCTFLDPPKLNKEVETAVSEICKTRDARIIAKHEKLQACLGGLSKIISTVLTYDEKSENIAVIEAACDTAQLVIDAMRDETLIRRSLILSSINSAVKDTLRSTDPDGWLFGGELSEKLRQAKLTGQDARLLTKKTTPSQLSKNGKPQLRQTYGSKAEAAKGYNRPMSSRTANRRSQRDRAQSPRRNSSKSSYKKDYLAKRRA
ncbi:hypothetical protein TKK_0006708 [Trichogramma kaykai]